MMMALPKIPSDSILSRLRKLCLALPGTAETLTWGHPNFRVENKIFIGYGDQAGHRCISGKVGKARQRELLRNSRYLYSDYVGRFGWASLIVDGRVDWSDVADLVLTSYRLIAPKKRLAQMDDEPAPRTTRKPKRSKKRKNESRYTPRGRTRAAKPARHGGETSSPWERNQQM